MHEALKKAVEGGEPWGKPCKNLCPSPEEGDSMAYEYRVYTMQLISQKAKFPRVVGL